MSPWLPLLAVVAGILSFTSPCALPLIPSYLSYVSGLPISELGEGRGTPLVLRSSIAFVAGFTVVFTALGASSVLVGSLLLRNMPTILDVAGVFIIALGLASIGLLRVPFLARERRFDLSRVPQGPKGAFPLGMAFAFGWTPCIGPVLATLLAVASATSTVITGGVLLALYSLGLGLPFLALALGFSRARTSLTWLRRRGRAIEIAGGVLLIAVGIMFVTGEWKSLFIPLQTRFAQLGWPPL
ncbi:cytochrome c biogenesis protein CcdA [Acidiferrimicrobium sp. IK]|jgi:cytochrome c-type biogenesis protein|uniref:cytochrome c biogenesis CcdA family protein n=1 Tax=Acidiferrimicrobium sp. IK TaxID=2871700 RepID=UPI0021CB1869|nr:cytochrome c biogenesis protein CcdA [Acidiferrimicrobium sp. IK]MCU4185741.1 cytochrome c biogenesis protein CcdA [Acidiferrimicrobium sp. IK]